MDSRGYWEWGVINEELYQNNSNNNTIPNRGIDCRLLQSKIKKKEGIKKYDKRRKTKILVLPESDIQ